MTRAFGNIAFGEILILFGAAVIGDGAAVMLIGMIMMVATALAYGIATCDGSDCY